MLEKQILVNHPVEEGRHVRLVDPLLPFGAYLRYLMTFVNICAAVRPHQTAVKGQPTLEKEFRDDVFQLCNKHVKSLIYLALGVVTEVDRHLQRVMIFPAVVLIFFILNLRVFSLSYFIMVLVLQQHLSTF